MCRTQGLPLVVKVARRLVRQSMNTTFFRSCTIAATALATAFLAGCSSSTRTSTSVLAAGSDSAVTLELAAGDTEYRLLFEGEPWVAFTTPQLQGSGRPQVETADAGDGWLHIRLWWEVGAEIAQDELAVAFELGFEPDFWWAPHRKLVSS
jgi:hypothetical protein